MQPELVNQNLIAFTTESRKTNTAVRRVNVERDLKDSINYMERDLSRSIIYMERNLNHTAARDHISYASRHGERHC
jgi:hypothetical protein